MFVVSWLPPPTISGWRNDWNGGSSAVFAQAPRNQITSCYNAEFALSLILSILAIARMFLRTRGDIALVVLAQGQQVAVLQRKRSRPRLNRLDRHFWTTLCRFWPRWADVLVIVKPNTVVGRHRTGFQSYWRWKSRPRGDRPKITEEIRALSGRLAKENLEWGAPKIHAELLKLGVVVSERRVARYLQHVRRRGDLTGRLEGFKETAATVVSDLRRQLPQAGLPKGPKGAP